MTLDRWSTTVEAAAAMAREDADDDRPTLGELAVDVCPSCRLRPTWVGEDVCEDCRTVVGADCRYDEVAGW